MRGVRQWCSLLVLLALMAACSGSEKAVMPTGETAVEQQQAIMRKRVATQLEKRNYHRAIELMSSRNHPGIPAAGMEKDYLTAINGLIAAGEESFSQRDYVIAGQSFRWALDAYPVQTSLRGKVRQEPAQIRAQLDTCASRLLNQGLTDYRSGNLESAISRWKEILSFDAEHSEAKKWLDTATTQLRALQNMEKPRQ